LSFTCKAEDFKLDEKKVIYFSPKEQTQLAEEQQDGFLVGSATHDLRKQVTPQLGTHSSTIVYLACEFTDGSQGRGSGSIITTNGKTGYVLTSAHNVYQKRENKISKKIIEMRAINIKVHIIKNGCEQNEIINAQQWIVHPNYEKKIQVFIRVTI